MLSAAALVDGYCQGREVPANLMTRWARDIAVLDVYKRQELATRSRVNDRQADFSG